MTIVSSTIGPFRLAHLALDSANGGKELVDPSICGRIFKVPIGLNRETYCRTAEACRMASVSKEHATVVDPEGAGGTLSFRRIPSNSVLVSATSVSIS